MKCLMNLFGVSVVCAAAWLPACVIAQPQVKAVMAWRCPPGTLAPCLIPPNSKTIGGDGNGIRPLTNFRIVDAHVDVERTKSKSSRIKVRLTVANDSPREFHDVVIPIMAEFDAADSRGYRFGVFDLKLAGVIPAGKSEDVQANLDVAGRPVGVWLRFPTAMSVSPKK